MIGFVGKSGSGKSSFAKLISHRLIGYDGVVYWNDQDLLQLDEETIKSHVLYVDNQGYLFKYSIKANLLMGKPDATDTELWTVLERVQLADFVRAQSEQLMTLLSENANNLSGGQRQRLLLGRALLKETDFYIFDEMTSGIDCESEEVILAVLQELARDKLVIFISHRLYNVMAAKAVAVFEAGQIVEFGELQQLRTASNYFKAYFKQEE